MSIGERIASLRKLNHISQGQIAKALSVSRQAVSKWENDSSSPDTLNLIRLADLLDTNIEYLATGRNPVDSKEPVPSPPIIINLLPKEEKIIERPVDHTVLKTVYRTKKQKLNPVFIAFYGCFMMILGFLIGLMF